MSETKEREYQQRIKILEIEIQNLRKQVKSFASGCACYLNNLRMSKENEG